MDAVDLKTPVEMAGEYFLSLRSNTHLLTRHIKNSQHGYGNYNIPWTGVPHPTALVVIPTCTTAPTQALVPAAHLPTGAETRLDTAVPAANLFSASALSSTSVLTACAALQTVTKLVLGPALATAARQEAGAATPLITARPVVSLALGLVMLGQEIFPPTVNAVPMARPALVLALETVARQEDGVAVPVITVVQVVSLVWHI